MITVKYDLHCDFCKKHLMSHSFHLRPSTAHTMPPPPIVNSFGDKFACTECAVKLVAAGDELIRSLVKA